MPTSKDLDYSQYTLVAVGHKEVEGFQLQASILNILPICVRPEGSSEGVDAELAIEVDVNFFRAQSMDI